jgi:hypothetical protein
MFLVMFRHLSIYSVMAAVSLLEWYYVSPYARICVRGRCVIFLTLIVPFASQGILSPLSRTLWVLMRQDMLLRVSRLNRP